MAIIGLKESIKTENRLIRGVWAAMFILAVGATVYYLYQTIFDYSDNPTATSVIEPIKCTKKKVRKDAFF